MAGPALGALGWLPPEVLAVWGIGRRQALEMVVLWRGEVVILPAGS